jgi:hypothetical protein
MPSLTVLDAGGPPRTVHFPERGALRLGADPAWSDVALPPDCDIRPRHAVIRRSALNRLLLVVDLAAGQTWVNRHPVVGVRVLRQGDTLRLGRCELGVAEVQIVRLEPGDPAVGHKCPVSRRALAAGDEVIACPGCGTVHERESWFLVEHCAAGCGYPNQAVILDTLPDWVRVERKLDAESPLVEQVENGQVVRAGEFCQAGQARDQVAFQQRQNVVYCPGCASPFHLECFLGLPACPACGYEIRALVDELFMAGERGSGADG